MSGRLRAGVVVVATLAAMIATTERAAAQAAGQRGYVGGAVFLDVVRLSGPEEAGATVGLFGSAVEGEAPGGAARIGVALGDRWGVEGEFAYPASLERDVRFPTIALGFADFALGLPGSGLPASLPDLSTVPFVPAEIRQSVSARAVTTSALLWYRRPLSDRIDLVFLGGAAFTSATEERTLVIPDAWIQLPGIGSSSVVAPQRYVTRGVGPAVGVELAIDLGPRIDLVGGMRATGASLPSGSGWLLRPALGARWRF